MSARLALKYGVVSDEDRLSNSSDAVVVTEPTTGSKARTKGSLYLVVTSRTLGGKTRDACRLVADTIRREYYYDESAGIAIVLEKALRAANRRLRHSREGSGLADGSIGIAVTVVRGNELYLATCGEADAYLIRSARLLMPEHEPGDGVPAADTMRVDVWRGELAVGDSLVLGSRNLVETVGTEELKNAVVTLHPQSAVEHLHHLFEAAGGDGSDAVLAIEANEVSLSRVEHKLVPVNPSEPLAGAPLKSPIPLADQISGAATAIQDRAVAVRLGVSDGFGRIVGGLLGLMPRRRTSYRRLGETATTRRETQRRAALAVLAFIGVVAVLGVAIVVLDPFRQETPISNVTEGEAALADATQKANQVFNDSLIVANPAQATELLRDAWAALGRAENSGVVNQNSIDQQRLRVTAGLEELYGTVEVVPTQFFQAQADAPLSRLVRGPDNAPYAIAGNAVLRVDAESGAAATIVSEDGAVAQPLILARGGPDLLIYDSAGRLWRWRPSDDAGNGTRTLVNVGGDEQWTDTIVDIQTFLINPEQGLYRLYVPFPPARQILRYDPTADGGGFSAPNPYFVSEGEDVAAFRRLLVDGDVYAVVADRVLRYFNGRQSGFDTADPPDDEDLRPGHDYTLIAATGTRGVGNLYVYDALHARVLVFDKADGAYVEQFVASPDGAPLSDVTGMYVLDPGSLSAPVELLYTRADGLYRVMLARPEALPTPEPSPSGLPTVPPGSSPGASQPPASPTPEPTERPIRTPQPN